MSFTPSTGRRLLPMQSATSIKPLKTIINNYSTEKIKALIESNFSIFAGDKFESSGLHHACAHKKKQIAALLIAKDPKMVKSKNMDGETPLHKMHETSDNPAIARMIVDTDETVLLEADNAKRTVIPRMISRRAHKAAYALLKDLSEPNKNSLKKFEFLCSLLPKNLAHMVFEYYRPSAKKLKKYINTKDISGRTSLDWALEQNNEKLISIIKECLGKETRLPVSRKRKKLAS